MRRVYIFWIALGLLLFLVVSALLARVFSADSAERSAITALVKAEASGDQNSMLDRVRGCRTTPSCRARVAHNATKLAHSGAVSIVLIETSAGFSLTSTTGTARVVWSAGSSLPVVQCVRVRRAGNAVSGLSIQLLVLSERIPSDSGCPSTF
jgi:hypothetical protein